MEPKGLLPHSQCAPPVPILSQLDQFDVLTSPFLKFHLNIFFLSTSGSSIWIFLSIYPTKIMYTYLLFPICATCTTHPILLDLITEQYWVWSTAPLCVVFSTPLLPRLYRPKYSPQHPILKHPQPTFLPQCERPNFTPIQNNMQNYSSVYLNLYIFG